MIKKVSPKELEELHEFCFFRSVVHYDMQVELVDHLATAIEERWNTNPKLPFQKALEQVDQQFGGHAGFVIIREEKEKAMRKKYRRLLWNFVAAYYKFPKILITFSLFLGIFTALQFFGNDLWIVSSMVIMFFAFSLFYFLYYFPRYVKIKVEAKQSFLLNQITLKGITSKTMLLSGGFVSSLSHISQFSMFQSVLFSTLASLFIVLVYADCFFIPKKIHEHFSAQFPQFVKS